MSYACTQLCVYGRLREKSIELCPTNMGVRLLPGVVRHAGALDAVDGVTVPTDRLVEAVHPAVARGLDRAGVADAAVDAQADDDGRQDDGQEGDDLLAHYIAPWFGLLAVVDVEDGETEHGPDEQSTQKSEIHVLQDAEEDHEDGYPDQISDKDGHEFQGVSCVVGT